MKNLINAYQIRQSSVMSAFSRSGITPPVIEDPDDISLFHADSISSENSEKVRQEVLNKLLAAETFEPCYLRPPPPLLKPSSSEVI